MFIQHSNCMNCPTAGLLVAILVPPISRKRSQRLKWWDRNWFWPFNLTLPETNSSHLKMDGWKMNFLLGRPIFRGYVSFREGMWGEGITYTRSFAWHMHQSFQSFQSFQLGWKSAFLAITYYVSNMTFFVFSDQWVHYWLIRILFTQGGDAPHIFIVCRGKI